MGWPSWLADLEGLPDNAAWPRIMSGPHPEAVGSYGAAVEEWARRRLGVRLRWWQALSLRLQYQHDAQGRLLVREVVESGPRRIGKSVRLRVSALWRIDPEQARLWAEPQLVLHTGKDLNICKEIHQKAYPLAESWGWHVVKTNGSEEIDTQADGRWLVRGRDSVYGYDVGYAMVDEGWKVAASVVDDGLEPATLERDQPQLYLTSTAHRKASSLMPARFALEPDRVVLLWGAPPGADVADPGVWRAASPWWSADRERLVGRAYARAKQGLTLDRDEPDPMEAFRSQYLNIWPALEDVGRWLPLAVTQAATVGRLPDAPAESVAAVEVTPDGQRWAVAVAWPDGDEVVAARVWLLDDPAAAVMVVGARRVWAHPAVVQSLPTGRRAMFNQVNTGIGRAATSSLRTTLEAGHLRVAGLGDEQWVAVRTAPADGGEMIYAPKSLGDVHGVKALSWAVWAVQSDRNRMGFLFGAPPDTAHVGA